MRRAALEVAKRKKKRGVNFSCDAKAK